MHRPAHARMRVARFLALVAVFIAVAIAPATANGGQFYSGTLSTIGPLGCKADWINQYGCAQSGFNYWFAVTLTKYNGERVALGMRGTSGVFYYFTYGAGANGNSYTLTKYDLGAPGYNRGFCAYYSGNSSDVVCTASL